MTIVVIGGAGRRGGAVRGRVNRCVNESGGSLPLM